MPSFPLSARPRRRSHVLFWVTAVLASFHFSENFAKTMTPPFFMAEFAYGHVATPWRRRVFMQWLYRLFTHVGHGKTLVFRQTVVTPEQQFMLLTAFLSLLLVVALTKRLVEHLGGPRWFALLPIYMLVCNELLITEIRVAYPYNPPAVLFFTLGLAGALLRNRAMFYTALLVGTLNRETTLFLPLVFLIVSLPPDLPLWAAIKQVRPRLWLEVVAQLALWECLVLFCEAISGGHGRGMDINWKHNFLLLLNPLHWPFYASTFGFLWIPVLLYWRKMDRVLLRLWLLILPLWAVTMFVAGDLLEIRLYSELAPLLTLCLASIAVNQGWLQQSMQDQSGTVLTPVSC